ncbi:V4R domain-containing protein [Methanobrevibacter curvatus]|uniref:V4R domain protein n=1 Tax=Methanobrevibacter curvatus TaxID=49547 RepID=A0A166EQ08_9EURY|nr:V4R domain-containing protein [Methanobrevibacter curvatus]KZX16886.1 V4R domain protein [Methanobrevibacter curvatus]
MIDTKEKSQYPMLVLTTGEKNRLVNVVKSPVKLKILNLLENGRMYFKDIVKELGKAKSTVSVHLRELEEKELITHEEDLKDGRKKMFFINSNILAEIDFVKQEDFDGERTENFIKNVIKNDPKKDFTRLVSHSVRSKLLENGISLYPLIYETGVEVGQVIYEQVNSKTDVGLIQNLAEFWEKYKLGRLEVEEKEDELHIKNYECFECAPLPKVDYPICYFELGVVETILKNHYGTDIEIHEELCMTMDSDYCLFVVKKNDKN